METKERIDTSHYEVGQEKVGESQKRQEGFIFYSSFEDAIKETLSMKNQLIAYKAIIEYGLYFKIPENLPKPVLSIVLMAKPQIDNNYHKRKNGKKGGLHGIKGADYGVSGGRPKKIDIPEIPPTPPNNDFRDEPLSADEFD